MKHTAFSGNFLIIHYILLFHSHCQWVTYLLGKILQIFRPFGIGGKTIFAPSGTLIVNIFGSRFIVADAQHMSKGATMFFSFCFGEELGFCSIQTGRKYSTHINNAIIISRILSRIGISNIPGIGIERIGVTSFKSV